MLPFSLSYLVSGEWYLEAPSHPPPTGEGFCCALSSSPVGGGWEGASLFPSNYSDNNEKIAREA